MSWNTRYGIIAVVLVIFAGIWWEKRNSSQIPTLAETAATSTDSTLSTDSINSPQADSGQAASPQVAASSDPIFLVPEVSQEKPKQPAETPKPFVFSLAQGETIASWDFIGPYKDGGALEAKVRAEIAKSKNLIDSGKFTNYELYVSIANQHNLLGDGKQEFDYLNKALAIDSTKTGLAWHNMGKLLERLGAYKSARIAYDRLIQAQSTSQYIRARLEFLQAHMPDDVVSIKEAEAALAASRD